MAIPEMLHLTSKNVPLRGFERRLARRNAARLRGWNIRIWTDSDNDTLFGQHFPDLLERYRALPFGVMRADVARLLYMHVYGGWYADTDYEWFRPPTSAVADEYEVVLPMENPQMVGNCVFASKAADPVWAEMIREMFSRIGASSAAREEILATTGPDFLTSILPTLRARPDIWLAPRVLFHSPVISAGPQAIGVHHTAGSWREHSFRWRLRVIERLIRRRLPSKTFQ